MKRVSRFLPSERCTRAEADHHYEWVHHRFAMRMFRDHAPSVRLYATNHAVAQFDLAGTFLARPRAWRFVILDVDDPPADDSLGGKEWLPSWAERSIVDDHTNFLREVRPFEVEPSLLVDRLTKQTTLAKYLVEIEAAGTGDDAVAAANASYERISDVVRSEGSNAFALRLAVRNRALREAEMVAVTEPGQAYAGRYLPSTTMCGIDELYFDHRDWAAEFFRSPPVREALTLDPAVRVGVYAVEELVGVDRR